MRFALFVEDVESHVADAHAILSGGREGSFVSVAVEGK